MIKIHHLKTSLWWRPIIFHGLGTPRVYDNIFANGWHKKHHYSLAHLRWSPYSRTAPLSWSWDFTCNPLKVELLAGFSLRVSIMNRTLLGMMEDWGPFWRKFAWKVMCANPWAASPMMKAALGVGVCSGHVSCHNWHERFFSIFFLHHPGVDRENTIHHGNLLSFIFRGYFTHILRAQNLHCS